ncbi:MAG: HAMP domain-containing histidine kinase [Bacilli bacterium]|nr:HAMP domain-containing histidine kinase [Bacilli bacterium]
MQNKIRLKKFLITILVVFIISFGLFLFMNIYEYHSYTKIYNNKIDSIIIKVKEKYPNISDKEIMDILYNNNDAKESFLDDYGININKSFLSDSIETKYHLYLVFNSIIFTGSIIILIFLYLRYDYKKDKEIKSITKYIEEINKRNYSLHIDEISEDELSILKNEIYKTTIMLKESAENSLKDKKELKKSLEDISHQLRTPLTSILVLLDNLIDDPDMDKEVREDFIRNIKREVTNINFLVQSILKLSKFDANTIKFINEVKYLKDIVKEASKNVSILCDLKNIKINISGDDKANINCDFMWQVEAITNIIKNCVEHSIEDSKIDIYYEQNSLYSCVIVRDYGKGIDKKEISHIFERFYKGKNSSLDSIGIGLALSKTIIEKSNGVIEVESDKNGTKFTIKYFHL